MSLASSIGLASGLNYDDLISKLVQANSRPIGLLQNQQNLIKNRQQSLQGINQALVKLQDAISSLNDEKDFTRRTANIGNGDLATIAATSDAPEGSFSLKVLQLAREHRVASQGVATQDATPIASGAGVFTYQIGSGTVKSISVSATTTLAQLRDAINSASSSTGVRASIVNDGTATNPFRLTLTASQGGAANQIKILANDTSLNFATKSIEAAAAAATNAFNGTVTSSGTYTGTGTKNVVVKVTTGGAVGTAKFKVSTDGGLTFGADNQFTTSASAQDISGGLGVNIAFGAGTTNFTAGDTFTIDAFDPTLQTGQDALIEIDGVQISRSSNTFSDAIDGVTITAKKVDAAATTVSIQNDNQNVNGLVLAFTQAYNSLLDTIEKVSSYDQKANKRGPLFGDSGVRLIRSSLSTIATGGVEGLSSGNTLGAIGIAVGSTGRLTVDTAKLSKALSDDFGTIKQIFSVLGRSTSTGFSFDSLTEATAPGTYAVNISTVAQRAKVTSAQAVAPAGITADETLIFTANGKTKTIVIGAGSTAASTASRLADFFETEGLGLKASTVDGKLLIESEEYGSAQKFTVVSDKDGAINTQLGIGTVTQSVAGVDVAGTIGGLAASGTGRSLLGAIGGRTEGLKLTVTAESPVTGNITVSRGIADRIGFSLKQITNSTDGLVKGKIDAYDRSIKELDDRIEGLSARLDRQTQLLRTQFNGLETKLNTLQSQGNFLLSQLGIKK